jgi:hypothetical protein
MNVRYRVELSQTERAELMVLLSGGKHAVRKLNVRRFCWPPTPEPATMISRPVWASAVRPYTVG